MSEFLRLLEESKEDYCGAMLLKYEFSKLILDWVDDNINTLKNESSPY